VIRVDPQSHAESASPSPPSPPASPPFPPASAPPGGAAIELSLIVELHRAGDDALLRVISLLHRRRCRVTAAEFSALPDARGRLALTLLAPPAHAARVQRWLGSLIDVREVVRT
jgi:hypothetical protein